MNLKNLDIHEKRKKKIMNNFPCTGCGACCRRIKSAVSNFMDAGINMEFPYQWDENGVCEMLTEDNKCSVYEDRPLICNIEKFAEVFDIDKQKFFIENIAACNILIKEDNLPEEFLIK
jgi:Fe-S-cluster containining protein